MNMKKKVIVIVIGLFLSVKVSYAGIYRNETDNKESSSSSGQCGALYGRSADRSEETSNKGGALYRNSNDDVFDRPGNGDGIGQAPVGDGISVLVCCCIVLGFAKYSKERKNEK